MGTVNEKHVCLPSGDDLLIRSATPEDAAAMLIYVPALLAESEFFLTEAVEFKLTLPQQQEWIQRLTDQPGSLMLLALLGGQIVGSLACEQGGKRRIAHTGTLSMGVRARCRGKGIGTTLLRTTIEWATANPALEKLSLTVFAANEGAIRLYRRMGFVEEAWLRRAIKYGPGCYLDDLTMARFVDGDAHARP